MTSTSGRLPRYPAIIRRMKKFVLAVALILIAVACSGCGMLQSPRSSLDSSATGDAAIARAFAGHSSGVQVAGEGVVTRILSDDNEGDRHQRFILRLASGRTLLFAHNISIASRVPLKPGDGVAFSGIYEWNAQGGLVHWTHRDPSGQHPAGWLKFNGATYQ